MPLAHGLTAETVVANLKGEKEDYKALRLSVTCAFDVQTAAERERALRLSSLL